MKLKTTTRFTLTLILVLGSCKTANHISNAELMMAQRNFQRAASEYSSALRNSPNNIKAFAGLQNASDAFIKEQLDVFDRFYNQKDYFRAHATMVSIETFIGSYSGFNIRTDIPSSYLTKQQNLKNSLAEDFYIKGLNDLNNDRFSSAISNFKKTQEYNSNYKDVRKLISQAENKQRTAEAEQLYQSGLSSYQSNDFRRAYKEFQRCLDIVRGYKNAEQLQKSAIEKGKVRIGIFEFYNNTRVYGANGTLYSYLINSLANNRSPFIDVIDRQNLDRLLNEIRFSHSGNVDASSAARAGKLLGLHYVVIGSVTNVIVDGGQILPQEMDAFELYHVSIDGKQQPRGRPVRFTLYQGTSNVTFEAQYQIIEVETGRIVKSNIVSSRDSDNVRYARYQGDRSKLYLTDPGAASGEGILGAVSAYLVSASRVNQELFTARTNLKSPDELQAIILRNIGDKISQEIVTRFE